MNATVRRRRRWATAAIGTTLLVGALGVTPATASPADVPGGAAAPGTVSASALMNWFVPASLAALRAEVDARWPGRDRSFDGTIGDTRHQARSNSHNPVGHPGGPQLGSRGAVHAIDITAAGIDVDLLLRSAIGDSRVWYVIHDGRIWSRTYGWAARPQPGDPHTTHIHISLRDDSREMALAAESDTRRWLTGSGSASVTRVAAVSTPTRTRALQRALIAAGYSIPSGPTGVYGAQTTAAVRAFQRAQGWSGSAADGIAGPTTLRRLGVRTQTRARSVTTVASVKAVRSTGSRASHSSAPRAYRPGSATREVYFMQLALIKRGYPVPAGATGYFGVKTQDAVRAFQRAQGWSKAQSDGVPGPRTLKLLGLT